MSKIQVDGVLFADRRPYPWLCVVLGHRWWRTAYVFPPDWHRSVRDCRRCAHMTAEGCVP